MKLTIDNLDGLGAMDYSGSVDRSAKLEVARSLNAPSTVNGMLCLVGTALKVPARRGRVMITAEDATVLFTGYLATEPVAVYAGMASAGAVYRLAFAAVSDEWLLDKQAAGSLVGEGLGDAGGAVVKGLLARLDPGRLATTAVQNGQNVGVFAPVAGAAWSAHAGAVADATCAAYRVIGGAMSMAQVGTIVHALSDGDGSLQVAGLRTAAVRELSNDVTVCGELEPATYWTEIFTGDGTTAAFDLTGDPAAAGAGHAMLLADDFNTTSINLQRWAATDPGSHLALGGGVGATGLVISGGNGFDGQTTLVANDAVEMGGTVVVELKGATLNAGSAGVLAGLYGGSAMQANCLAGFNVRQAGGNTLLTPLVNGVEVGTAFTVLQGHAYTLRLRLHCAELLRVKQVFYALDEATGTLKRFGGGVVDAPLAVVFEVRDNGQSSNTPVTVLYDGSVASSFASARLALINSLQLFGSIGSVTVQRMGSAWVRATDATTGAVTTRLAGGVNDGLDFQLVSTSVTGKVTFYPQRVPQAGVFVTVLYRGQRRAVARLADAASLAAEAAGGGVGTARWLGRVVRPAARSSEDCENAAQALLGFATSRAAAVAGTYLAVNPAEDVWPGDVLALSANGSSVNVIVRAVTVEDAGAAPEALTYRISFANDWAEGMGLRVSEVVPKDVLLPETALEPGAGAAAAHVLANLQQMAVTSFTGTGASAALTVDAGMAPPAGGGFEVRRRDGGFGGGGAATGNGDLVLRSPVRGFTIPRGAMEERFFVRMYDGSTPPLYSRESSAIVTHVPLG